MTAVAERIFLFYWDGLRNMRLGRTLWLIILVKLVVIFAVLKLFFFPDLLAENFHSDQERADHVLTTLTQPTNSP